MLLLLSAWAAIAVVTLPIGSAALSSLGLSGSLRVGDASLLAVWIGSVVLGSALLAVSLVHAITPDVAVATALCLMVLSLSFRSSRNALTGIISSVRAIDVAVVGLLAVGVALFSAQPVSLYDTGLYHQSIVELLSRYGSVIGIANLHDRLGFTSSWFALAAAFNFGAASGRVSSIVGGYALLVATIQFTRAAIRILAGRGLRSDWFAVVANLIVVPWLVRTGITISPSPDVPVLITTILFGWSILLEPIVTKPPQLPVSMASLSLLLSAAGLSLKLSAAPLVLIAAVMYVTESKGWRHLAIIAPWTAVFVLPLLLANVVTSGCPLYPSPVACLHVSWSVGSEAAANLALAVRSFLQWNGAAPANANWWNWIPHWAFGGERLGAILVVYAIVSALGVLALARRQGERRVLWTVAVAMLGILYVAALSPSTRFLIGYAAIPPAVLFSLLAARFRPSPVALVPPILLAMWSIRRASNPEFELGAFTRSAFLSAIYPLAGAVSTWLFLIARRFGLPKLQSPFRSVGVISAAVALPIAALFSVSNYSLIPNWQPLPHALRYANYSSIAILPPAVPQLGPQDVTRHLVNDVVFFSPPPGTYKCWSLVPCTPWPVSATLHLLDPSHGFRGGLGR